MSAERRTAPGRATIRRSWWPGWIWAVPLAAIGIGAWLLVRALAEDGTEVTIRFSNAHGVRTKDTSVVYRGMQVGRVTGVALAGDGTRVDVQATIEESAAHFLSEGTVFWLRGAQPGFGDLSSLGAVLTGPTIVMEPGTGSPTTTFRGRERKPAVPHDHGRAVPFAVVFEGSVGALEPGDAVTLRGFPVGEVKRVGFHYDAASGRIRTPLRLVLYPKLFHVRGAETDGGAFRAIVGDLVARGLRAELTREPPLVGSQQVVLEMMTDAPEARLDTTVRPPAIPAAPGGGLGTLVRRAGNVPIERIGQHVLGLARRLDRLASSPELTRSLHELEASLSAIHRTVRDVGPKVDRLVETLQDAATRVESTVEAADAAIGGPTTQTGLRTTLREMEEAARAVRTLAAYLDRQPEALVSGRSGD